jgi:hypothetical protein
MNATNDPSAPSPITPDLARLLDDLTQDGYGVLRSCVANSICHRVLDEVWDLLGTRGVQRNTPMSWMQWPEIGVGTGLLTLHELYHLPAVWELRQVPRIHEAFAAILGTQSLLVSLDRVGLKRPSIGPVPGQSDWAGRGFMHLDINPWHAPRERQFQGLVALSDAAPDDGGFWCLAGMHRELDQWASTHAAAAVPSTQTMVDIPMDHTASERLRHVPLKIGDLLVWDSRLPHGNAPSRSERFRGCVYIRMFPSASLTADEIKERVDSFLESRPPRRFSTGTLIHSTPTPGAVRRDVRLGVIGERLLGSRPWPASR